MTPLHVQLYKLYVQLYELYLIQNLAWPPFSLCYSLDSQ